MENMKASRLIQSKTRSEVVWKVGSSETRMQETWAFKKTPDEAYCGPFDRTLRPIQFLEC